MSEQELELPKGWVETKLDEIAKPLQAGGPPSTKKPEYYKNFLIAKQAGVNFLAYRAQINKNKIIIDKKIKIIP